MKDSLLAKILATLSWCCVLALWGCALSTFVHPPEWFKPLSLLGLGFPFAVAATVGMGLVSLLFKPRVALIALVGLVGCFGTLRDYCPVNLSSPPPKGALKLVSYNTLSLKAWAQDTDGQLLLPKQVMKLRPDIVCFQEVFSYYKEKQQQLHREVRRYGYHVAADTTQLNQLTCISRYPIARIDTIFNQNANGAVAFYLVLAPQDTLCVINMHLASMGLTDEELVTYEQIVRNPEFADDAKGKKNILRKISNASYDRCHQADIVAAYIDRLQGRKLVVMGDMNDTPVSYTHHTICSRLTDVFRATGNGIGRSFHKNAVYVRIDHAFCSDHFKPFAAQIDHSLSLSDHYPLVFYLKPLKSVKAW